MIPESLHTVSPLPQPSRGRRRWPRLLAVAMLSGAPFAAEAGPSNTTKSAARIWDEEILNAIRIDTPNPPVHARNLFHLSVAMWDAWAAFDTRAVGCIHRERVTAADVAAARHQAISYAALRILQNRFAHSVNAAVTLPALEARMSVLGYDPNVIITDGDSPAAVGNRVAESVLNYAATDDSNQDGGYGDDTYFSLNPPLILNAPGGGTVVGNPNTWQPLAFDFAFTQNGLVADKVQPFIGARWGLVRPFALERTDPERPWIDTGGPPLIGTESDSEYKRQFLEVVELGGWVDGNDTTTTIDISPGAHGNNPLGSNAGTGHALNPVTGQPYAPNVVLRSDYARVLAEFWADGPHSETPPGHWNVLANDVADHPATVKRIGGKGPVVGSLEWDVKVYLALNAAVHDAACVAWNLKRHYDSVRPITAIRYMSQMGQSSDPLLPSYNAEGMWLKPGVAELVTAESSAPGGRHEGFASYVGQVVVKGWPGEPVDPTTEVAGTRWILGRNWIPYQRKTFVTPAFPGYVSGHSTFSRAGAEILAAITGTPFFPGGVASYPFKAHEYLIFEDGPNQDLALQWATYFDAADQAARSRLFGGIHIEADDFHGRMAGSQAGKSVWAAVQKYFDGSVLTEGIPSSIRMLPGECEFTFHTVRGMGYTVQTSVDLENWTDEMHITAAEDVTSVFLKPVGPDGREWFRVVRE